MTAPTSGSKTGLAFGECKDEGGIIDDNDVACMRRVAESLPASRFEAFIIFSKLGSFTDEELARIGTLNSEGVSRVILLTPRELEPYMIYSRSDERFGEKKLNSHSLGALAESTRRLYFSASPREGA